MKGKIRFYLYILGLLWLGAAVRTIGLSAGRQQSVEAVLMEKEYPGQLSEEELKDCAARIFAEKKAESVQGISEDGIFSAYGYSPFLPGYVTSGGKRMNLNVVSFYNEETDTTKIIAASPVYNGDF